jgi:hypothetical protein
MSTRLYHTTTAAAAAAILREGFRDATGSYMFEGLQLTGVFFADEPVGINEGAGGSPELGDPVLVVDIPEAALAEYRINEELSESELAELALEIGISKEKLAEHGPLNSFREWCIPAAIVNRYGPPKVLYDPLEESRRRGRWPLELIGVRGSGLPRVEGEGKNLHHAEYERHRPQNEGPHPTRARAGWANYRRMAAA